MSHSHLYLKAGFPRAILGNGLGRYVCQLQRITIKFCKSHGSSRGIREFIENDLVDFAKNNPGIVVYVKPRRHRSPVFVAEYLNGSRKWMTAHNFSRTEVISWLDLLKNQKDGEEIRLVKRWHTDNPSIQGPWNPYLFMNPQFMVARFPDEKLSLPKNLPPSATEILTEMFKNQQINETNEGGTQSKNVEGTEEEKTTEEAKIKA